MREAPALWLQNGSCHHPLLETDAEYLINNPIQVEEVVRALSLAIVSALILVTNSLFIFSINLAEYHAWIPRSTRYLLTSLSVGHLLTGLLVTSWGVLPTLTECWPYGRLACQIQAIVRGALRQQTAFSLVLLAMERYVRQVNFEAGISMFTPALCLLYSGATWLTSFCLYTIIVTKPDGYQLSYTALAVCEPYYRSLRVLVVTSCLFYFPTTMVVMYCYGTIYSSQKLIMKNRQALMKATLPMLVGTSLANQPLRLSEEAQNTESLIRCLSALSLAFIIVVTPWSILQVITSVTMERPPARVDFTVTLLASSCSLLSPLMFWLLNPRLRRTADTALYHKVWCWSSLACCSSGLVDPLSADGRDVQPDLVAEKLWGEILERTARIERNGSERNGCSRSHRGQEVDC